MELRRCNCCGESLKGAELLEPVEFAVCKTCKEMFDTQLNYYLETHDVAD